MPDVELGMNKLLLAFLNFLKTKQRRKIVRSASSSDFVDNKSRGRCSPVLLLITKAENDVLLSCC